MVGEAVKQIPSLKHCHAGGKLKSLKKVVAESNEVGDSITVNDIVIEKLVGRGQNHKFF